LKEVLKSVADQNTKNIFSLFCDSLAINEEMCSATIKKIMTQSRELENTILKAENIVDNHSRECGLDIYKYYYSEQVEQDISNIMKDYDSNNLIPWKKADYQKNLLNYLEKELQIRIEDKVNEICHRRIEQIGKDLNDLFFQYEKTIDVPLLQIDWSPLVVYRRACTAIITTFTALSVALLSVSSGALFTLPVLAITGIGTMGAFSSEYCWSRKSLHHEIENIVKKQLRCYVTKGVESGEEIPTPIEKTQKKVMEFFANIKVQVTTTLKSNFGI